MKYDLRWKYETTIINNLKYITGWATWNIAGKPIPVGEEKDWIDTPPPDELKDEYKNYKNVLTENNQIIEVFQTPTEEQFEKKYRDRLKEEMPNIIANCESWEEVEVEKQKIKDEINALEIKEEKQNEKTKL